MSEHDNAAQIREGYEAFASGDMEKLSELIPENAVWHVTGKNVFSGDYKGRAEVFAYFGNLVQASGGTFKAGLVHAVADDKFGMAIQRTSGTFNGQDVSTTDILVERFEDGQAVETWVYLENESLLEGVTL